VQGEHGDFLVLTVRAGQLGVLLAPGLAYVLRHERAVPGGPRSAFRETLRVVFVSVASLTVTGLLATLARWAFPEHTVDVSALVRAPVAFARGHHVQLAWWSFGLLVFATLLAWAAADPRLIRLARYVGDRRPVRWLTGAQATDIIEVSTWWRVFEEQKRTPGATNVGVLQDNGSYVQGTLLSYSTSTVDYDKRELILTAPLILVSADGHQHPLQVHMVVIAGRNIVRLDVTHLSAGPAQPDNAATSLTQDAASKVAI
jgi:hypothetical protein